MRAAGMQVLTDQVKAARPGVVIYGIGDEEHQEETSGHNEDDTPGVSAEDQDADSVAEHRALDFMIGPSFTIQDGWALVADLTGEPANRARLIYVNWWGQQWHRKNNWVPVPYTGSNPHKDHVHASGEADQDANTAPWSLNNLIGMGQDMTMFVTIGTDPKPKPVYKSDGWEWEHLTSEPALSAVQAAGYRIINVPDQVAFKALCGVKREVAPPANVIMTPEQLAELARLVSDGVLQPMADAQRASAAVLDGEQA